MCGANCTDTIVKERSFSFVLRNTWKTVATQSLWERARWLVAMLHEWRRRHRSRRYLLEMNDFQLRDIGIERDHAIREASKPFWRI